MAEKAGDTCAPNIACDDFGEFQEVMKGLRTIDDRIVHALNTTIPTASFASSVNTTETCKKLHEEMDAAHRQREQAIKKCIAEATQVVNKLKEERLNKMDDIPFLQKLRKEQTKLRLMQNELNIEEVIQDRSIKVFYERCRHAYKPPGRLEL